MCKPEYKLWNRLRKDACATDITRQFHLHWSFVDGTIENKDWYKTAAECPLKLCEDIFLRIKKYLGILFHVKEKCGDLLVLLLLEKRVKICWKS
jgi:hypothetical protein